jgi:hypothetical protein
MQAHYRYPTKRRDAAARHRPDEALGYSFRDVAAAIATEGGPALMREVWRKFGGAIYPQNETPAKANYYTSIAERRRQTVADLTPGATATRPSDINPGTWREVGRALITLGYLEAVDLETYRRTDKPGPMPITPHEVMGEIQRRHAFSPEKISSRLIREQFLCNAEPGQVIERPPHLLPESWRIAVQPLCRLAYFEAVAKGDDKFFSVRRTARGKRVPFDNYEINAMTRKRFGRTEAVAKI